MARCPPSSVLASLDITGNRRRTARTTPSCLRPTGRVALPSTTFTALLCAVLASLLSGVLIQPALQTASADVLGSHAESRPGLAAWFVQQINDRRVSAGRARLPVNGALATVAGGWAARMARTNVLAHNQRLATSIRGWRYLGENVGVGYSAGSLEGAFWASAPHRSNMLDPDFTQIGVAVMDVGGKLWVVQDYSRPATGTRARPMSRASARPGGEGTRARGSHRTAESAHSPTATGAGTVQAQRPGRSAVPGSAQPALGALGRRPASPHRCGLPAVIGGTG